MIYNVYIKVGENNIVYDIVSDWVTQIPENYIKIDSGEEKKYQVANALYLQEPLFNDYGVFNYQYLEGKLQHRDASIIQQQIQEIIAADQIAANQPSIEQRVQTTEQCILEMSQTVYDDTLDNQIANLQKENANLKEENQLLTDCILELSQLLYGETEET